MKKSLMSIALLAALLSMVGAGADEFSGGYVGGKVGSNRSDTSGATVSSRNSATTYGLEGGYGWNMGSTVLGVNGFYDSNNQATHTTTPAGTTQYGSKSYGLGLKVGLPINNFMPYAKLGYGHVGGTGSASNFGGNAVNGGLGLEYKFTPSWSVAGEWATTSPSSNGTKFNNDNFTIGVNYYFGTPKAAPAEAAPAPVAMKEEPKAEPVPQPKESWKIITEEKPVHIEGASFNTNSAKLKPTADAKLKQVVDFANQYPDANLEISGYTDSTGSKAYNLKLSQKRAESVKAYLVKKGIAADRISAKGFGMDQPVADNKTKAGRALNRRVEVRYTIREEKKVRVQ